MVINAFKAKTKVVHENGSQGCNKIRKSESKENYAISPDMILIMSDNF